MKGEQCVLNGQQYALMLALVVIASFGGGVISNRIFSARQVLAQLVTTNTIPVPNGGVEFKTPEGRLVAKLTADNLGGHLQIFNTAQQAVTRLDGWAQGGQLNIIMTRGVPAIQVAEPRPSPQQAQVIWKAP